METKPKTYTMREVHSDILRIIDENDKIKENGITKLGVRCPYCKEKRYVAKANLNHRSWQTTYCKDHKWIAQIGWASPKEFSNRENFIANYDKQIVSESAQGSNKRVVFVEIQCPSCAEWRWCRLFCLRSGNPYSTICRKCSNAQRGKRSAKKQWRKGTKPRSLQNGYVYVHEFELERTLTKEQMELVRNNIKCHRGYRYPEHRVVALLKFGVDAVGPGIVARHMDGDKTNNNPINIEIGTMADNIIDNVVAIREMKRWRKMALELMKLIALSK